MRDLTGMPGRIRHPLWGKGDAHNGCFVFVSEHDGGEIRAIASNGGGWDHVSVSREDSIPSYEDMQQTYRMFFQDHEVAMQLHVPSDQHINNHPNTLHLWRPRRGKSIPRPPAEYV